MNRLLSALFSMLGIVPARRHEALARQVNELRSGSADWKAKAADAMNRVRTLEQELRRQTQLAERLKVAAEKAGQKQAALEALQARLEHAERELAGAREHLMVIEVKLDILEGAANVLDGRMRAAASPRTGDTRVPA